MRFRFLIPALLLNLVRSVAAQEPTVEKIDESLHQKTKSLNAEYLVLKPNQAKERLPLVIYLHGAGGVGDKIRKISGQIRPIWAGIQKFGKHPCLLVAPQCDKKVKDGGGWLADDLDLWLSHLKKTLPVDEKRIYLTGNSMGGYGSWVWGGNSPQHFAAIAPISGGIGPGGPKDVTPDLDKWAVNLAKVPVYAFVGGKDRVVPPDRSERMILAIRKAGGQSAKIKIYPNESHGARQAVFSSREYYDWLFAQKRK